MGEGEVLNSQEQFLVVFPFPEPTPLIQSLREQFPGLNLVYYFLQEEDGEILKKESDIPKGAAPLAPLAARSSRAVTLLA
jgi:hypothetical protein